jgi:hypothetical protein
MAPRTLFLFLASLPLPPLLFYQQDLRLTRLYPTIPVPPYLDVPHRKDFPEIGMVPGSGEGWRGCQAADAWAAVVPQKILLGRGRARQSDQANGGGSRNEMVVAFARAYWDSWPLRLERIFIEAMDKWGWQTSPRRYGKFKPRSAEDNDFERGAEALGRLVSRYSGHGHDPCLMAASTVHR